MKLSEMLNALGIKPPPEADKVDLDLPVFVEIADEELPVKDVSFYYNTNQPRIVLELE